MDDPLSDSLVITEDDFYDADPSPNGSSYKNKRTEELDNMKKTELFKDIGLYPVNIAEMDYLVEQLDILKIFPALSFDIDTVLKLTPKRLDAFFLILKKINLETIKYCEHIIRTYFEKEFCHLFLSQIIIKYNKIISAPVTAFLEEFLADMGNFFIRFLSIFQKIINKPDNEDANLHNSVSIITQKMTRYCFRLLKSQYYKEILETFDITVDKNFFVENNTIFENMTKQIIAYTNSNMESILNNIKLLATIFMDNNTTDDDLLLLISSYYNIRELVDCPSDAIDHFNILVSDNMSPKEIEGEKIIELYEYDNFLYTYEHKQRNKKYAFWLHNGNTITSNYNQSNQHYINRKANAEKEMDKLGMVLYPEKAFNDILETFVHYKLVNSTEDLIQLIIATMEAFKNEPGIFNKYDETDLETSFLLMAISNDIDKTYDSFLIELKTKLQLPNEYPIEFVLRIISRVLGVIIKFYDRSHSCVNIDNIIYQKYISPIIIYQSSFYEYYIPIPKGSSFNDILASTTNSHNNATKYIQIGATIADTTITDATIADTTIADTTIADTTIADTNKKIEMKPLPNQPRKYIKKVKVFEI